MPGELALRKLMAGDTGRRRTDAPLAVSISPLLSSFPQARSASAGIQRQTPAAIGRSPLCAALGGDDGARSHRRATGEPRQSRGAGLDAGGWDREQGCRIWPRARLRWWRRARRRRRRRRRRTATRCSGPGPRRSRCRRSTASRSSISCRRSTRRSPPTARRSRRSPATEAAPTFANTIEALERAGRRRSTASRRVFFNLAATDTNDGHPGHRAGAGAALCQARHAHLPGRDAVCPRRCPVQEAQEARAERGAGARARALSPRLRQVRRRARAQGQEAHGGDRRAHVGARHPLQPEPAGRRAGVRDGAGGRARPRRPARGGARGGGADGQGPRPPRQARHHAGALLDRAVPAVFGPARSAREGVQGLDHARRQRRQDRQPQDRGRDPGAAGPSGRGCWASRRRPTRRSSSPWPRRPPPCASC